ncbi:Uncharacterized protein dnm_082420 [Desulfonema magnum]|uniref:Uncharacterized protein n=1 Tax=Desulfonema magnum TaxID=45655 RepID=A0A975BUU0_9BACT|nr:Uncharacterized protein dnm_082420 [Desulfonema magnum]
MAKKRMCPAFYPKKISHKDTKEAQRDFVRLCETLRLRAFVAKKRMRPAFYT